MLPLKDDEPRYSTPYVNTTLIVVNIAVFCLQFAQMVADPRGADQLLRTYGEIPAHLAAFVAGSHRYTPGDIIVPFFTSMFLHGGCEHVIGNMWFLYIFGDNVEDYLGHGKFLAFYLFAGARVLTWFFVFIMYIPAWFVLGEWFVMQFLYGTSALAAMHGRDMGGVA